MAKPPIETTPETPFFSRWSQRKRKAQVEPPPEEQPEDAPEAPPELDAITPEELEALPKVDELTEGADIRPFLRKGVPQALRNAALRRMWMLTPAIRDYQNPAVDYAYDWNTPGGVPGDGAAPSLEKAAQMVREIVAPRTNPQAEAEAEADDVDENPAERRAAAQDEAAEPTPARVADTTDARPSTSAPDTPSDAAAAPRRRHGGALPD